MPKPSESENPTSYGTPLPWLTAGRLVGIMAAARKWANQNRKSLVVVTCIPRAIIS